MAAWLALIASVLGRKKDDPNSFKMGTIGEAVNAQPGEQRTFDESTGQYVNTGSPSGEVQPGQQRVFNQGTGTYQNNQSGMQVPDRAAEQGQSGDGGGFQNAMGTVNTIGSVIGGIQGNKKKSGPYQMQLRRL
ncbi:MAG: hypothetical protein PHN44_01310 [Candidatus Marinimicrobia bacterium]|nr:hypothetical protein [Candidatus Neomarinimicrobiota bacterium]